MTGLELLKQQFNGHVAFRERRPDVVQVLAPLFHEEGDMVDIFIDESRNGSNKVRISDHGMTLMRLMFSPGVDRCGHEGRACGVRTLEALRCPLDAVLSREHTDQSRGERRRGMLLARGTRPASESTLFVAGVWGYPMFVAGVWGYPMFVAGVGAYSKAGLEGLDCQRVRVGSVVSKPDRKSVVSGKR